MTRVFDSADKLADFIQNRTLPRVEKALDKTLDKAGKIARKTAHDMVGKQQPGLWAPLKDSTIRIKRANGWGLHGNPASPLYATGTFRRSIFFRPDYARRIGTIGTDVKYIVFTEYGTDTMPPRPVFRPALHRATPEIMLTGDRIIREAFKI